MREQGAAYNNKPLQFGEMQSETVCMVGDLKLEGDDFMVAEHLTDYETEIDIENTGKRKVKVYNALKKGDIVLVQRMSDEQYVIIERLVEA
jgi:hypothetical protein